MTLAMMKAYLSVALVCCITYIAHIRQEDTPSARRKVLYTTSTFMAFLAWSLWVHGGRSVFPRLLPLALTSATGVAAYAAIGSHIAPFDRLMTNAAPILMAVLTLYTLIPRVEDYSRHLDIILLVTFGLPLIYAAPFIFSREGAAASIPAQLYTEAYMASAAAYRHSVPPDGVTEYEFVQNVDSGARCGIFSAPNRLIIAFSGSDSRLDWVRTNLDGTIDATTGIHEGFLSAWHSIRDRVLTLAGDMLIRNGGGKNVTILLTGHSLGGALATVSALDIQEGLDRPLTVVTFGAPPVGNAAFINAFDSAFPPTDTWRVFTIHDPIPKLIVGKLEHSMASRKVVLGSVTSTALNAHDISHYAPKPAHSSRRALVLQSSILASVIAFFSL